MTNLGSVSPARTPWHYWVIAVLALLWNCVGAFDYLMTQTKNEAYMSAFTPAQLEYFYGFPTWVVAAWAIAVWGGVVGALLLLLRKRLAVPVLVVSFTAMVATTLYNFGLSNGYEIMGGGPGGLVLPAVIFLIALALVFFARAMRRRGVLS